VAEAAAERAKRAAAWGQQQAAAKAETRRKQGANHEAAWEAFERRAAGGTGTVRLCDVPFPPDRADPLALAPGAKPDVAKKALRAASLRWHPDKVRAAPPRPLPRAGLTRLPRGQFASKFGRQLHPPDQVRCSHHHCHEMITRHHCHEMITSSLPCDAGVITVGQDRIMAAVTEVFKAINGARERLA
jgi:hypothetical protein